MADNPLPLLAFSVLVAFGIVTVLFLAIPPLAYYRRKLFKFDIWDLYYRYIMYWTEKEAKQPSSSSQSSADS